MRTLLNLLTQTTQRLADAGCEEARLEAELLLMHAAGLTRAQLYSRLRDPVDDAVLAAAERLTARRERREPLAYILGHREFYGRDFQVDRHVLIPRPETEMLVEAALRWLEAWPEPHPKVADTGTGSGIIAVSIAASCPRARVYATDSSRDALQIAWANAQRHRVSGRIALLQGDLLEPLPEPVDLLLANLPYVKEADLPAWCGAAQVELAWEPFDALAGGEDGLDVIRRYLAQAPAYLKPGGAVFLEIGYDQGRAVAALARQAFPDAAVSVQKDPAGIDRLVTVLSAAAAPGSP